MQVAPNLVAGCGNPDAGDDAFGHRVIEILRTKPLEGIEAVHLGLAPAALFDHLPGRQTLIIVDAAVGASGTHDPLLDLDWFDPHRPAILSQATLSTHGLTLAAQIELARQLQLLPAQVRLIAWLTPGSRIGDSPGGDMAASVCAAVRRIHDHAAR